MRICLIINSLARGGGAERVVSNLANHWSMKGHEVDLILLENETGYHLNKKIKVHILNKKKTIKLIKPLLYPVNLIKIFRRKEYDLTISFLFQANVINIISSKILRGKSIYISERSFSIKNYDKKPLLRYIVKLLYPMSTQIIAISNGVKNSLEQDFNISSKNIKVIPNPVTSHSIQKLSFKPLIEADQLIVSKKKMNTDLNIVSMGRLIESKNFKSLIEVIKNLIFDGYRINLTIIGEGPLKEELIAITEVDRVEEFVSIINYRENPFNILKEHDLFICPSTYEAFGNVVTEAMCLGLPIITLKGNGGPNEIVGNGEYGLIYKDESHLSFLIKEIISGNIDISHYKKQSFNRIKKYEIEKIADDYLKIMEVIEGDAL